MRISVSVARDSDASAIVSLRTAVAESLTRQYGRGHWSSRATEAGVSRDRNVASACGQNRQGSGGLGAPGRPRSRGPSIPTTLNRSVDRYISSIWPSSPAASAKGVGRRLIEEAKQVAVAWPADAVWLDAYAEHTAARVLRKVRFQRSGAHHLPRRPACLLRDASLMDRG